LPDLQIVHRLADFWSASSQLRSQLLLLKIKYPVDILASSPQSRDSPPYFKAKAQVLFPSVQAKAFIYFHFSFNTLTQWPLSLGSLDCEVEVAYGPVE
jgi:kinetochore protein Spc7/SPC105